MYVIGQAAKITGVKVSTIRFYEQEGLLAAPPRTESGRRLYSDSDMRRLAFIRHARALGFELGDIRSLLDLDDHPDRPCNEADLITRAHLKDVEARLAQLMSLRTELLRMVSACEGGTAARCLIIETLADHSLCQDEHGANEPLVNISKKGRPRDRLQGRSRNASKRGKLGHSARK